MPIQPSPVLTERKFAAADVPASRRLQTSPVRIALSYLLFGRVWIWLTDRALVWLGIQGEHGFWAAAGKGTLFVVLSSLLIYWLSRREIGVFARSNSLLKAVAEGTTDAIYIKDTAGRYLLFNQAASDFVGKSSREVLGNDDTLLFPPDQAAGLMREDRQVMERGVAVSRQERLTAAGVTRTFLARRPLIATSTDAWWAWSASPATSRIVTVPKNCFVPSEIGLKKSSRRFRS